MQKIDIIGVGVLAVPYAFWQAGWLLSLITLALVSIVSYVTMVWMIEVHAKDDDISSLMCAQVMARMEGLKSLTGAGIEEEDEPLVANSSYGVRWWRAATFPFSRNHRQFHRKSGL